MTDRVQTDKSKTSCNNTTLIDIPSPHARGAPAPHRRWRRHSTGRRKSARGRTDALRQDSRGRYLLTINLTWEQQNHWMFRIILQERKDESIHINISTEETLKCQQNHHDGIVFLALRFSNSTEPITGVHTSPNLERTVRNQIIKQNRKPSNRASAIKQEQKITLNVSCPWERFTNLKQKCAGQWKVYLHPCTWGPSGPHRGSQIRRRRSTWIGVGATCPLAFRLIWSFHTWRRSPGCDPEICKIKHAVL